MPSAAAGSGHARAAIAGIVVPAAMILALPLVGVYLSGEPVSGYLEFPPRAGDAGRASFAWPVFLLDCGLTAAVVAPFALRAARRVRRTRGADRSSPHRPPDAGTFPAWGWAGLVWTALAWAFAWTRRPELAPIQPYSFTPLWAGYIVTMSALAYRRAGRCLMTSRPKAFLLLFPASAAFWWLFEYLNRFVRNWHYPAAATAGDYFLHATLSFATVLPAVCATREWLLSFPAFRDGFSGFFPFAFRRGRIVAWGTIVACGAALAAIGLRPDALYPVVWVAPPLLSLSALALAGEPRVVRGIPGGDWSVPVSSAAAALVCGFFWEMWNSGSLVRWVYTVPYADAFRLFGMPAIGYAGYLPFGLTCAVVSDILTERGG